MTAQPAHPVECSVFVGVSLDGFMARQNGDYDFLKPFEGQEHGYKAFMAAIDTLVIGRNTYEIVLKFDEWPYAGKRVVVLSTRPVEMSQDRRAAIEQMAGAPEEIVKRLAASGATHVYVDGGITIQRFLRDGLIQRLIVTRVPVLIGTGIPLFGALAADVRLDHVATRVYPSGMVQSEYTIGPATGS